MKMKKDIVLKIYIKYHARPFTLILESKADVDKFHTALLDEIVHFGPLTFKRSDFKYAIEE